MELKGSTASSRKGTIGDPVAKTVSAQYSFRALLLYFLRLGTFGFGGPIALAGRMEKDLVATRGWISRQDYIEGLAFSQLSPGPLAAQLAMYLGWARGGRVGALLMSGAFVLPSFTMALGLAAVYVHFGQLAWIQEMFHGIGAAVIAIIAQSAIRTYYRRFAGNPQVKVFVQGVTAAPVGAIAGAALALGRRSLVDLTTVLIAIATFLALGWVKKAPEPVLILMAGLAGLAFRRSLAMPFKQYASISQIERSVKLADEYETDSAGGIPVRTPINAALLLMFARASGLAQQPPLTINQAVQQALDSYPAVRSALEQVSAAAAGINLARTAYLPGANVLGQMNRATHNNVFGQLLPQSVIPSMTGPALGTDTFGSVWATATGTLVSWEPFDFGLRKANVDLAFSAREQQRAQVNVTKLQVAVAAADAFFTILAARQTVTAAGAGVERAKVLNQAVEALVNNQLRPGADASRTRAELALAQTQLIQAEEAVDIGRAALGQLLGVRPQTIAIESGPLLQLPSEEQIRPFAPANHPASIAQNLAVEEIISRERVLDRSYFPRFELQGAVFGRATGIRPNGETKGVASGLGPDTGNWAVGMTVTFPVFEIASIRARKKEEFYNERAERARYEQTLRDLTGQMEEALAALAGARRVAQNTPIELDAARIGDQQANARYRSGLTNIVEVAEAERILTQAEIDDALAKLGVWRALLAVAAANGDLQPFLRQAQ